MWQYLQSKWQSLIFRLLLYFLLSMLALAIIVGFSFAQRLKPHFHHEILPNVERYIEYIIDDIGNPPDLAVARQLADRLPIEIRIVGQDIDWASSPMIKPADRYRFEPAPPPYDNVYIGHHRRDEVLLIRQQAYQYLFTLDNGFRQRSERRHWILFLMLGGVLFVLYLAIRRMFRPIGVISQQVEKIGQGDLEQTIASQGRGELAMLAEGINRMSARIKSMLESKSGLLLAISHELRSPITRMRVNLELLEHSETRQKLIDDIHEMEALVAAILESEKLNTQHAPLSRSRCEMIELIDEVIRAHPCRDRIKSKLSPQELSVDRLRIRLLLKNLLDNACHYSGEQAMIEVSLESGGEFCTIAVRDQGMGIDSEQLPHITEAFYRPDSARQRNTGGYGLGLYLCRLIVDAHGGRLTIESEPGVGTRVTVSLPLDNS